MASLTQRERDVLRLLADGRSNDEIGKELFISPETVRSHVRKAMSKLDADTRTQAVATALRQSLIANPSCPEGVALRTGRSPRAARAEAEQLGGTSSGAAGHPALPGRLEQPRRRSTRLRFVAETSWPSAAV